MLVLARAQATSYPEVTWVSEYPATPLTDYGVFGSLPTADLLGTISLTSLTESDMDALWSNSREYSVTTVFPKEGQASQSEHWSAEVDSDTNIVLTLSNNNLSTSWARVNGTDITPRREV